MAIQKTVDATYASYLSAMECVLNGDKAIYCSSELTSGLRAFGKMREHGVKSSAELKEKLGHKWRDEIFIPNAKLCDRFAAAVRKSQNGRTSVITPAPLYVDGWGQPDYNGFWKVLIHTSVGSVRFNHNWQFSNGCTFEFMEAQEAHIPTLDMNGKAITVRTAADLIQDAITEFIDLDTSALRENLDRLVSKGFRPRGTVIDSSTKARKRK